LATIRGNATLVGVARAYNVPLDALIKEIDREVTLWVRVGAVQAEGRWSVRLLELTSAEPPPNWTPIRWQYSDAVLVASMRAGAIVAKWLSARHARVLGRSVSLAELGDTVSYERRESHWTGGVAYGPLSWPIQEWQLSSSSAGGQPTDLLVADDSPSFVGFDNAAASLLGVPFTGWNVSGREFVARFQDQRGRISGVRLRPTEAQVRVDGRTLRGAVVELAGQSVGPTERLKSNRARTVRFPLPGGVPEGSWIVLRRGNEWLDRRFLTWPFAHEPQPGVEIEIEPATQLEALASGGEGPTTEFKSQLPANDDASRRKVMKSVAAFANGEGGTILFGLTDEGELTGLDAAESGSAARDTLTRLVQSWISPLPAFRIEAIAVAGRKRCVLVLTVERGDEPPYAAGTQPTNYIYYVRRGANSFPIAPSEVRALVRSREAAEQRHYPVGGTPF
jgi:hypothetical protein